MRAQGKIDPEPTALKAGAMPRRIVAAFAMLAVLVLAGCAPATTSSTTQGTNPNLPVMVPSVVGKTEAAAITALDAVGLKANVRNTADKANIGLVVIQHTPVGDQLTPGSAVEIVVGYDPNTVVVPDVVRDTRRDAEAALLASHLKFTEKVSSQAVASDASVSAGEVYKQSPKAGAPIPKGTRVTIWFLSHK
jgi:serine/threonine-protein kinase